MKPIKVKPEDMWILQDKILIKGFKRISQELYNRKLLKLYRAMAAKKSNGSELWDFIRMYPVEMLNKFKLSKQFACIK